MRGSGGGETRIGVFRDMVEGETELEEKRVGEAGKRTPEEPRGECGTVSKEGGKSFEGLRALGEVFLH